MVPERQKSVLLVAEWADARFQRGVARYAKRAGWHLNLDCVYSQDLPWGWQGDGCIAMAGRPELSQFVQSLDVPVVDVTHQTDSVVPKIHEDDQAIGMLAAEYFLELGFVHFACYRTDSFDVSMVRQTSFAARIREAGHSVNELCWNRYGHARRRVTRLATPPVWTPCGASGRESCSRRARG